MVIPGDCSCDEGAELSGRRLQRIAEAGKLALCLDPRITAQKPEGSRGPPFVRDIVVKRQGG